MDEVKGKAGVTPCVGVWIETRQIEDLQHQLQVTPCVGVWIETTLAKSPCVCHFVTPCVGVWIETNYLLRPGLNDGKSHPAWVCGLKQTNGNNTAATHSHTLRGCVD